VDGADFIPQQLVRCASPTAGWSHRPLVKFRPATSSLKERQEVAHVVKVILNKHKDKWQGQADQDDEDD
jgi:hypothetical protein